MNRSAKAICSREEKIPRDIHHSKVPEEDRLELARDDKFPEEKASVGGNIGSTDHFPMVSEYLFAHCESALLESQASCAQVSCDHVQLLWRFWVQKFLGQVFAVWPFTVSVKLSHVAVKPVCLE